MRGRLLLFILLLTSVLPFQVSAAPSADENLAQIIESSCRAYDGSPLRLYLDPVTHQFVNPLLGTKLGRKIFAPAFKDSILKHKYFSRSEVTERVFSHPELKLILDRCYGSNKEAKANFLYLVSQLSLEGKYSAFMVEAFGLALSGGVLKTVVVKIGARFALSAAFVDASLRWATRLTTLYVSLSFAQSALKIYQLKKKPSQKAVVETKTSLNSASQKAKAKAQALDLLTAEAMKDLAHDIAELKKIRGKLSKDKALAADKLIAAGEATLQQYQKSRAR